MKSFLITALAIIVSCTEHKEINNVSYVEGTTIKSFDFNGLQSYIDNYPSEKVVVNFWATWCAPCIKEIPAFEKITEKYNSEEVKVLLVSLDFPDQIDKLTTFIDTKEIKSEVVFLDDGDANSWIPKIDKSWSGAIPATLIKTKKNKKFYEQSFSYAKLENEIKEISN